jgi:hypothetical protein
LWDLSDFDQDASALQPFGEGRDWKRISASRDCFVGLKSDGTLWEWGRLAVFGNNAWSSSAIRGQVQVGTDHDWIDVWGSSDVIVALKTDGSIWRSHFVRYEDQNNGRFVDEPERWLNLPHDNPVSVSASSGLIAAVFNDGTLWIGGELRSGFHEMVEVNPRFGWRQVGVISPVSFAAIREDGSFWVSTIPTLPPKPLSRYRDWIALRPYYGRILTLAADGSLCRWQEPGDTPPLTEGYVALFINQHFPLSTGYRPGRWFAPSQIKATKIADIR